MGVDTWIRFPVGVELNDVAKAIAILLGKKPTWTAIIDANHYEKGLAEPTKRGWIDVSGITYKTSNTQPECCTIQIKDIGDQWWLFWNFEMNNGHHGMSGHARAERIALHRRLAQFFGGTVNYQDCDARESDYRRKPPAWLGYSNNDKHFHAKELALWNLKPLSEKEIQESEKWAAYKKG